MWRQIARRPRTLPEPRVVAMSMQQFSATELHSKLERAALVVPCFGYRSAVLPVFDAQGERLALSAEAGGGAVGADSRLLASDGTTLPHPFGLRAGTGYPFPPRMGGGPNFSRPAPSHGPYPTTV